jgi:hypothetical protein
MGPACHVHGAALDGIHVSSPAAHADAAERPLVFFDPVSTEAIKMVTENQHN